ncbi:uncharacterized protein N7446_010719 [Penicillium canescens]|nr:uncharacterized protein N7446_010719 [Penicillium canescens]KAJ6050610.1 hypothetical protein N7446_010719 [Penicillium canescens]KAJ6065829.1 hypothetical protein N7444_001482 [Penicillium canescens]
MDAVDENGAIALAVAVRRQKREIVSLILAKGSVPINKKDKFRKSALVYAVEAENLHLVSDLLDIDDVDPNGLGISPPISIAAARGNLPMVERFLSRPDIDVSPKSGVTPLYCAAKEGHLQVVRRLLSLGDKIDIQQTVGDRTALSIACDGFHFEIAKLLIQHQTRICHSAASYWKSKVVDTAVSAFKNIMFAYLYLLQKRGA